MRVLLSIRCQIAAGKLTPLPWPLVLYVLKLILRGFLLPVWRATINESNLEHGKQANSFRTYNHIDRAENASEI